MMYLLEGGKGRGCLCTWKAHLVLDLEKECWPREICLASDLFSASYLWDCRENTEPKSAELNLLLATSSSTFSSCKTLHTMKFFKKIVPVITVILSGSFIMSVRKEAQSPEAQNRQLVSSKGNWASLYPLASPHKPWLLFLVLRLSSTLSPTSPK